MPALTRPGAGVGVLLAEGRDRAVAGERHRAEPARVVARDERQGGRHGTGRAGGQVRVDERAQGGGQEGIAVRHEEAVTIELREDMAQGSAGAQRHRLDRVSEADAQARPRYRSTPRPTSAP